MTKKDGHLLELDIDIIMTLIILALLILAGVIYGNR